MKYIKLFENELNLKKYLVDDASDREDIIYLWEVISFSLLDNEISFIEKNYYNVKENFFMESEQIITMPISRFKRLFNVVYQTDSYKDAKERFLLLVDAKKYNL